MLRRNTAGRRSIPRGKRQISVVRQARPYSSLAFALAAEQRWLDLDAVLAEAERTFPMTSARPTNLVRRRFKGSSAWLNAIFVSAWKQRHPPLLLIDTGSSKEGRKADAGF
jgi:hypothetical protein